jgi:hypothetical protein
MRTLAVLALLAACTASLAVARAPAASGACKVPKLTGLSTKAARKALATAGCPSSALRKTTTCAPKAKVGIVLSQKPSPRTVLTKGRRIDIRVGVACAPPPIPVSEFVGDWRGTYDGSLKGDQGCPDIPISGAAAVTISGSGLKYTVSFTLDKGDVITNSADCKELGRTTSSGEVFAEASGNTLNGPTFGATLAGGVLTGKMSSTHGMFTFSVTRAS